MNDFVIPYKKEVNRIIVEQRAERDRMVLDFLSNPKMDFRYAITPDGKCRVTHPITFLGKDLREAVMKVIESIHK